MLSSHSISSLKSLLPISPSLPHTPRSDALKMWMRHSGPPEGCRWWAVMDTSVEDILVQNRWRHSLSSLWRRELVCTMTRTIRDMLNAFFLLLCVKIYEWRAKEFGSCVWTPVTPDRTCWTWTSGSGSGSGKCLNRTEVQVQCSEKKVPNLKRTKLWQH